MKIHVQFAIKKLFTGMVGILYFQTDTLKMTTGKEKRGEEITGFCFLSLNLQTFPPTHNMLVFHSGFRTS